MTLELDDWDIQGNILQGYRFPHVAHLFGRIEAGEVSRWKRFLLRLVDEVTPARSWGKEKPRVTLNIGLSHRGIAALQRDAASEIAPRFPAFAAGMASRSRELGDGDGFDKRWDERHVWLAIHARESDWLDQRVAQLLAHADVDLYEESPRGRAIVSSEGNWYEHFGFRDDISFPAVEGTELSEHDVAGRGKYESGKWRKIATGEFLLGHLDESGTNALDGLSESAQRLLQNGTFAAFRRLRQNVPKFRGYLREHSGAYTADYLASRMMGRTPAGVPLAGSERDLADFTYEEDQRGARCPFGAHVRRVNPRNTGRHRVIRRGITFGPPLPAGVEDDLERGLWFVALNANIEDQFEFIQKQWMNAPVGTLTDARDPIGGAGLERALVIEGDRSIGRAPVLLLDMPVFVTCQGGQYYFVPGLGGLVFLCAESAVTRPPVSFLHEAT